MFILDFYFTSILFHKLRTKSTRIKIEFYTNKGVNFTPFQITYNIRMSSLPNIDPIYVSKFPYSNMTDISIITSDGIVWYSKYQLSKISPVLNVIFTGDKDVKEISENDSTMSTVESILLYYELDEIKFSSNDNRNSILQMYELSHKWDCSKFEDKITDFLIERCIPNENIATIFKRRNSNKYIRYINKMLVSGKCDVSNNECLSDTIEIHRNTIEIVNDVIRYINNFGMKKMEKQINEYFITNITEALSSIPGCSSPNKKVWRSDESLKRFIESELSYNTLHPIAKIMKNQYNNEYKGEYYFVDEKTNAVYFIVGGKNGKTVSHKMIDLKKVDINDEDRKRIRKYGFKPV